MLGFVTNELVWAVGREREEEARNTHPHTEKRPDSEKPVVRAPVDWGYWIALALRGGVRPAGNCR